MYIQAKQLVLVVVSVVLVLLLRRCFVHYLGAFMPETELLVQVLVVLITFLVPAVVLMVVMVVDTKVTVADLVVCFSLEDVLNVDQQNLQELAVLIQHQCAQLLLSPVVLVFGTKELVALL
jgi:hypothetical protein